MEGRGSDHASLYGAELRNLEFWDRVSYDGLVQRWVPTCAKVPGPLLHGVAHFKGALCDTVLQAQAQGDQAIEARWWKLLTFVNRLLLAQSRAQVVGCSGLFLLGCAALGGGLVRVMGGGWGGGSDRQGIGH